MQNTAATTRDKPKLDNLPNEIIQKIWLSSDNPYLNRVSRKLRSSLKNEHVERIFYRRLGEMYLRECLLPVPMGYSSYPQIKPMKTRPASLISEVLERSQITNSELWDLGHDGTGQTRGVRPVLKRGLDGALYGMREERRVMFLGLPDGTRVPKRLWKGDVYVRTFDINKSKEDSWTLPACWPS